MTADIDALLSGISKAIAGYTAARSGNRPAQGRRPKASRKKASIEQVCYSVYSVMEWLYDLERENSALMPRVSWAAATFFGLIQPIFDVEARMEPRWSPEDDDFISGPFADELQVQLIRFRRDSAFLEKLCAAETARSCRLPDKVVRDALLELRGGLSALVGLPDEDRQPAVSGLAALYAHLRKIPALEGIEPPHIEDAKSLGVERTALDDDVRNAIRSAEVSGHDLYQVTGAVPGDEVALRIDPWTWEVAILLSQEANMGMDGGVVADLVVLQDDMTVLRGVQHGRQSPGLWLAIKDLDVRDGLRRASRNIQPEAPAAPAPDAAMPRRLVPRPAPIEGPYEAPLGGKVPVRSPEVGDVVLLTEFAGGPDACEVAAIVTRIADVLMGVDLLLIPPMDLVPKLGPPDRLGVGYSDVPTVGTWRYKGSRP